MPKRRCRQTACHDSIRQYVIIVYFIRMNKAALKHRTNSYFRKLNQSINDIFPGFETETIHQFRVNYKKLRAFFRMLASNHPSLTKPLISKNIKICYRICGEFRDLQLQQLRMNQIESMETLPYCSLLIQENDRLKPELTACIAEMNTRANKKKMTDHLPEEFTAEDYAEYAGKIILELNTWAKANLITDDEIHSFRKLLKDLMYNFSLFKKTEPKFFINQIFKEINELDIERLLTELGEFQDKCSAIELISLYWLSQLHSNSRLELSEIRKKWIKEKSAMRKKLEQKIKSIHLSPVSLP